MKSLLTTIIGVTALVLSLCFGTSLRGSSDLPSISETEISSALTLVGPTDVIQNYVNDYSITGYPDHYFTWNFTTGYSTTSSNGPENTLYWTSTGQHDFNVVIDDNLGNYVTTLYYSVNVYSSDPPILSGGVPSAVCAGTSWVLMSISSPDPDATYQWDTPAGISVAFGQGTPNAYISYSDYPSIGDLIITPVYPAGNGNSVSYPLGFYPKPSPVATIQGNQAVCEAQGSFAEYHIAPVDNVDYYIWRMDGTVISGANSQIETIDFTGTSFGYHTISVSGYNNNCGEGHSATLQVYYHEAVPGGTNVQSKMIFSHNGINSLTPDVTEIAIDHCEDIDINNCNGLVSKQGKTYLKVTLDFGDTFNYGSNDGTNLFSEDIAMQINAYSDYSATILLESWNVDLHVESMNPEQVFLVDISDIYEQIYVIQPTINSYGIENTDVPPIYNDVRLAVEVDKEVLVGPDLAAATTPYNTPIAADNYDGTVTFDWSNLCDLPTNNFQFELLRLYNTNTSFFNDENTIQPEIDWSTALSIETQSDQTNITLTIAERRGYYAWRVRPIGNLYPGGIANNKNWGTWSTHVNGSPIISGPSAGVEFFDGVDPLTNWIYSRTFTEGDYRDNTQVRMEEKMTFANDLNQAIQTQRINSSEQHVLTIQTVFDYSGRPSLVSLPVPLNQDHLGYQDGLLTNNGDQYTAQHFDSDLNYQEPMIMDQTGPFGYYSTSNLDPSIPSAEGYHFTRDLYYNDGTARVKEVGGAGDVLRLNNSLDKTTKIFYSGVSDLEMYRIFGDEAPLGESVVKSVMIDPNNSANVTYKGKNGQIIATCRSLSDGYTYGDETKRLAGLDSQPNPPFEVVDYITGSTPFGDYGSQSSKTLTLTETTTLGLNYELNIETIQGFCTNYCAACDYFVTFEVYNMDDVSIPVLQEYLPVDYDCSSLPSGPVTYSQTVVLDPGTYLVSKKIVSNNVHPSEDPLTYLQVHLQNIDIDVQSQIDAVVQTAINSLDPDNIETDAFYLALDPSFDVNNPPSFITVEINDCGSIEIPVFTCEIPDCTDPTIFSTHFYDHNPGMSISQYTEMFSSDSQFEVIMENMTTETFYDCQQLWDSWIAISLSIEDLLDIYDQDPNMEFDIMNLFLESVGYHFLNGQDGNTTTVSTSGSYSNGNTNPGFLSHPYLVIEGSLDNSLVCQSISIDPITDCVCAMIEGNGYSSLSDFTDAADGTIDENANDWYAVMKCIEAIDNGTSITPPDPDDFSDDVTQSCLDFCDYRAESFQTAILNEYYSFGVNIDIPGQSDFYMESDPILTGNYLASADEIDWGTYTGLSVPYDEVLCMTEALVQNCYSYCQLTVEYDGADLISVGTEEEIENIQQVFASQFDITIQDLSGACPDGYDHVDDNILGTNSNSTVDHHPHEFMSYFQPNTSQYDNVYWVNTTDNQPYSYGVCDCNPGNDCSLSAAVYLVNQNNPCETNYIGFNIPSSFGQAPYVIQIDDNNDVPVITNHVYLDAESQPDNGYIGIERKIHLNYTGAFSGLVWGGLEVNCDPNESCSMNGVIRGFEITNFEHGIVVNYSDSWNYINNVIHDVQIKIYLDFADFDNLPKRNNFYGNVLGATASLDPALADTNGGQGLFIFGNNNDIGGTNPGNANTIINQDFGVQVRGVMAPNYTGRYNRILNNRIYQVGTNSSYLAIYLNGGNSAVENNAWVKQAPIILGASLTEISGTSEPDDYIQLFRSNGNENADEYVNSVFADAFGNWTMTVASSFGDMYVATATEKENTSQLSDLITVTSGCKVNDLCFKWTPVPEITEGTPIIPMTCAEVAMQTITNAVNSAGYQLIQDVQDQFEDQYMETCVDPDNIDDSFWITYELGYYHYTLYYYDRAGNMIKTVAPSGVDLLTPADPTNLDRTISPNHEFVSEHYYNSLAQKVRTNSPDEGETRYVYNDLGQLRFYQDAQQTADNECSYFKYNRLGIVIEAGVADNAVVSFPDPDLNDLNDLNFPPPSACSEQIYTHITIPSGVTFSDGRIQRNLTNRISYEETNDGIKTHYSYDPHGNVEWIVHEIPLLGKNYIEYSYDLIGFNLLEVIYNEGYIDEFHHKYCYDESNRLKTVETSSDGVVWDKDATYEYFDHGSLRRVLLGEDMVQGNDYTQNIQGWAKALNHSSLDVSKDPGHDGDYLGNQSLVAKDAFGMILTYHEGDFKNASDNFTSNIGDPNFLHADQGANERDLYNGHISSWTSRSGVEGSDYWEQHETGHKYWYDELNRIKSADFFVKDGTDWEENDIVDDYATRYSYDANGNITHLMRNGSQGSDLYMDDIYYTYGNNNNQLLAINENISTPNIDYDIEGPIMYSYDDRGSLLSEVTNGDDNDISSIEWLANGKIKHIEFTDPSKGEILLYYDADGERTIKEVIKPDPFNNTVTYYVRDGNSTLHATYEKTYEPLTGGGIKEIYTLEEHNIYGANRLGVKKGNGQIIKTVELPDQQLPVITYGEALARKSENKNVPVSGYQELFFFGGTYPGNLDLTSTTPYSSFGSLALWSSPGKNACVAEDLEHNIVLYYNTLSSSFGGSSNIGRLFNADGNFVGNQAGILTNSQGKSLMIRSQEDDDIYYLFTIDTSGVPRYHVIDINANNGQGYVIAKNIILDESGGYHSSAIAAFDDHSGIASSKVFMKRTVSSSSDSQTQLVEFNISPLGVGEPLIVDEFDSHGANFGELQISPDGSKLAMSGIKNDIGWFAFDGFIKTYALDIEHDIIATQEHVLDQGALSAINSIEFSPQSKYIYFNQLSISPGSSLIKRLNIENNIAEDIVVENGEIRRGFNNNLYCYTSTSLANNELLEITNPDFGGIPMMNTFDLSMGSLEYHGGLALQPHTINVDISPYYTREIGQKRYETIDHTYSVRITVSDIKVPEYDSNYDFVTFKSDLKMANNYYAFGMLMPERHFQNDDSSYGFAGQEKDDDIKGKGNSTSFKFRIQDNRIGRFFSVDPLSDRYPMLTPYQFAANNPIGMIEIEGLEGKEVNGVTVNYTASSKPKVRTSTIEYYDDDNSYDDFLGKVAVKMTYREIEWTDGNTYLVVTQVDANVSAEPGFSLHANVSLIISEGEDGKPVSEVSVKVSMSTPAKTESTTFGGSVSAEVGVDAEGATAGVKTGVNFSSSSSTTLSGGTGYDSRTWVLENNVETVTTESTATYDDGTGDPYDFTVLHEEEVKVLDLNEEYSEQSFGSLGEISGMDAGFWLFGVDWFETDIDTYQTTDHETP